MICTRGSTALIKHRGDQKQSKPTYSRPHRARIRPDQKGKSSTSIPKTRAEKAYTPSNSSAWSSACATSHRPASSRSQSSPSTPASLWPLRASSLGSCKLWLSQRHFTGSYVLSHCASRATQCKHTMNSLTQLGRRRIRSRAMRKALC